MNAQTISGWIRANILGFVAIFIALTGTAVALPGTDSVESDDIIDGDVRNVDLHDNAVNTQKIALNGVTTPDLQDGSVTGAKIADGSVAAADVAPDSLGGGQIDETSLDSSVLQHRLTGACGAGSAIRNVDASGNVICEGVGGGGSPTGPAGGGLAGSYPNPTIAANAVGNAQIADNSVDVGSIVLDGVGSSEIAPDAVGSSEIATGAVTNPDIALNTVSGSRVQDSSLSGSDIANNDSLGDAEIDQAALDIAIGKTAHDGSSCFGTFDGGTCATMDVTLPRPEHVLLMASGEYVVDQFDDPQQPSDTGNTAKMSCFLSAGSLVGSVVTVGEKQTAFGATPVHDAGFPGNFVVSGITGTLPAGPHTFELTCDEDDGAMDVTDARITAVTLD